MKGSSSLRLRPRTWRYETPRISSPFDMNAVSKRFHVAEGPRTVLCDVTNQEQVLSLVDQTTQRFGRIYIVVNSTGIIQVDLMSTTTVEDFVTALDVMF